MEMAIKLGKHMANAAIYIIEHKKTSPNMKLINRIGHVRECKKRLDFLIKQLSDKFPEEKSTILMITQNTVQEYMDLEEQKIERNFRPIHAVFDGRAVVNLSKIDVPSDIQLLLSFGEKFVLPHYINLSSMINIMSACDRTFENTFPVETRNEAIKQTAIQLNQYHEMRPSDQDIWLLFIQYRMNKFIKKNEQLLIMKSDKGKHTVIINRDIYLEKMELLIHNTKDYERIVFVDIAYLEDKNNCFVRKLKSERAISDVKIYIDSCTLIAQMYGLIKVHKSNYPVRPITSACGSPGFKLAGYLTRILSELYFENGFHVENSLIVRKQIEQIYLDDDDVLVSFDVISMFTNITTDVMLQIIEERKDALLDRFHLQWDLFQEMFDFVLRECAVFNFNGKHYKQIDTLAMGSPLSPILAKILMSRILEFVLIMYGRRPKYIALYMDDSLWIINKMDVDFTLHTLNLFHDRIKFTMEMEKEFSINFLDITIERRNHNVITCWYKKPFASFRLLNFFSNHDRSCIIQTAISYIKMVLRLSHEEFFTKNYHILSEILRYNIFPETVIIMLLHNNYTLMKPLTFKDKKANKGYSSIPFHSGFSKPLSHRLLSLHPDTFLTLIPDRSNTNHFSLLKDKVGIGLKTNIILLLECDCRKYIDIRHTKFGERAEIMISTCTDLYDTTDGKCLKSSHKLNKWSFIRCKNYQEANIKYNLLLHVHRNRLSFALRSISHPSFTRQLNKTNVTK